jgi:hypothetical protein
MAIQPGQTGYKYINPNLGPQPQIEENPLGLPAALSINNLGYPVTSRSFQFRSFAVLAWGDEWDQPDHDIYTFPFDRDFDSTDQYTTGVYSRGITPTAGILQQSFYRDAPAYIMIAVNNEITGRIINQEGIIGL